VETRREIDDLIKTLVDRPPGESGRGSRAGSPASKGSGPSSVFGSTLVGGDGTEGPRTPQRQSGQYNSISISTQTQTDGDGFVAQEPEAGNVVSPKAEYVSYSVGMQTDEVLGRDRRPSVDGFESENEDEDQIYRPSMTRSPKSSTRLSRREQDREAEVRESLRQEIEAELRAVKDPGLDDLQSDQGQARFPARTLTTDETAAVTASSDFLDFVERSSKVIERALEEEYDVLADYALAGGADMDDDEDEGYASGGRRKGRRIKEVARFYDEKWSKRRMNSDLNFSPKFPELLVASYTKSSGFSQDYAGVVQVWNLHLRTRPEYTFLSTSDVLTAKFSPYHPHLIIGGSYSGQVLLWDTRSRSQLPVQKTPLTGAAAGGHTHPIYSIDIVGTQNANNIISCSTDGIVCGWTVDMLSQPQEYLELTTPPPAKADDIAPTCMAFPPSDPTSFLVGKAGVDTRIRCRGHTAPIMGLNFHGARGPVDLSDLVLTTGLDWSVKLWKVRPASASAAASSSTLASTFASTTLSSGASVQEVSPLLDISRDDAVFDARWSPVRPAIFALVDGAGNVEVWDLLQDLEVPVARATQGEDKRVEAVRSPPPRSLNKCCWDEKEGKRIGVGGASGLVSVFEVGADLSGEGARVEEWAALKRLVGRAEQGVR